VLDDCGFGGIGVGVCGGFGVVLFFRLMLMFSLLVFVLSRRRCRQILFVKILLLKT
jgi:hypothetical protein